MKNVSLQLTLYGCVVYVYCVGFASLDIVCDELNECAWKGDLLQLSDLYVIVYSVESFGHSKCYSDCSRTVKQLDEPLC